FSALTAYEKGLFCAFVGGEALCLMSDATMAILDEHITQGKLGEAEAIVAAFAREGATLAEKNTLELGFSEDAAKAAGLFVANVAKNLQHARPAGKVAPKKTPQGKLTQDVQYTESGRIYGTHKELKNAKAIDSHHIIQDKAVQDIPGYNRNEAPTVQLKGPSSEIGTEHYFATQEQRQAGGGTYGVERVKAYRALRKAGVKKEEAKLHIQRADDYFSELGVTQETQTKIPGNRKGVQNAQQ
ncbi:MAG: hypothetical protein ACRC5T_04810, partial [Cetobacterium sp.]